MLKIGFRVDAGNLIGTGHLMEVVAVIEVLREKLSFEPVVITAPNQFSQEKLREIRVDKLEYLAEGIQEQDEVRQTLAILKENNCRHLVLDLLRRSNEFYAALKEDLESTCVILDNAEHKEIPATIAVNFSITQDPGFYRRGHTYRTRYLIGPRYFLRDKEIIKLKPRAPRDRVERILVNQGGSDPYGLTAKIIRAMDLAGLDQEIIVVLGGCLAEAHQNELAEIGRSLRDNYNFYINVDKTGLYALMQQSDLAISAAGNTLYELVLLGVPTLVISHHELHDRVASAFEKKGAVLNLGVGSGLTVEQIAGHLMQVLDHPAQRRTLSLNAGKLFDSPQENPLIEELVQLYASKAGADAA